MTPIAIIPKNSREEYRVTSEVFKGTPLVHFRVWYLTDTNEYAPSHKGVAIPPEQLPAVIEALTKAQHAIAESEVA